MAEPAPDGPAARANIGAVSLVKAILSVSKYRRSSGDEEKSVYWFALGDLAIGVFSTQE
jgi:hypothetical protein